MKTRAEIYGNEAAALLRIVTMYPGLNMQQLLCFHPGKEEIIKTLLSHLQKQGRIFQTDTGGYFPSGWAAKSDNSLIRAALGEKDCTRISVMEKKRFPAWLAEHENTLKSISDF